MEQQLFQEKTERVQMSNQSERDASVKTIEITAKTIEEAIERGLQELNASREQVEVEILKEGRRGVFGLGSEEAEVRLTLKPAQVSFKVDPPAGQSVETNPPVESVAGDVAEIVAEDNEEDDDIQVDLPADSDLADIAVAYLAGILERLGVEAKVTARMATDLVEPGEEPPLVLDVTGSDLGILIGRRSETLRALQYMVRLMVSKQMNRWHPIVIDVESYRVRRRHSLHQLAEKMAERAVSSRRQVVMEAMPAYERRIIHIALRNHPAVITRSVGSEDNRKVTIIPK